MRKQLREYLREGAKRFVESLTVGNEAEGSMLVAEAIEAIKEEAAAMGYADVRSLNAGQRQRLINGLMALDLAEARNKFDEGKGPLIEWLREKLTDHVPYRTLSDGVLRALMNMNVREH